MAEDEVKRSPTAVPPAPLELAGKIQQAIEDAKARVDIHVRLNVEGGQHEERYEFRFDASGAGEIECGLKCKLSGRAYESKITKLTSRDFASLLQTIDTEKLAEASKVTPRIPPDSLVGRLQVTDGNQEVSIIFMADPEQAKTAGYEPPPQVAKVIDKIYKLGAKKLGTDNVRP